MINLSVNINKIASLRNTRDINVPDLGDAVELVIAAGCQGITVHPRIDQRHIRFSDLQVVKAHINGRVEYNIECDPHELFINMVLEVKPTQCTLVPTKPNEITSSEGFDLKVDYEDICKKVKLLKAAGIRTSLFSGTEIDQIRLAKETGTDAIELYTGPYAMATGDRRKHYYEQLYAAAALAHQLGLRVHCGHDLTLDNLGLIRNLPGLAEVSIGHHLIVQAMFQGLPGIIHQHLSILND
ncbi:pyridoxine 5'-phosphate synthase [Chitinophaga sp. 22321]|uniref:Pyridoxine 5'-phosphate synthase n=1 Tax=Chitinophaga hostae TaxID=2831022 RepID=A0ABS5J9A4_9BACT|nr:pyridoxine 5'-phosphate synthase [Chitinophaga hostae]MBS0031789.1 pyridoxine 5'-phosphate synthase [Chitinophaga hostae]